MFEYICIAFAICFILILVLLIYYTSKKYILGSIPNISIDVAKQKLTNLFLEQRWNVKEKKEHLHVESGSFTAVDLHFKQKEQDVEVYYVSSATALTWVLVVIGLLFIGILTLIVGIIADHNSKKLAKTEILPLFTELK